jgi:hypothetical protein
MRGGAHQSLGHGTKPVEIARSWITTAFLPSLPRSVGQVTGTDLAP